MHDLNAINRLNREAFAEAGEKFRKQGRFVLARYDGAALTGIETFSELTHAQWALELVPAVAERGERATIFAPFPAIEGTTEAPPVVHTLADYIARKYNPTV